MALLSGGLLLRVVSSDFEGSAAVSGAGGLRFCCGANVAPTLATTLIKPLMRSPLILCAAFGLLISVESLRETT